MSITSIFMLPLITVLSVLLPLCNTNRIDICKTFSLPNDGVVTTSTTKIVYVQNSTRAPCEKGTKGLKSDDFDRIFDTISAIHRGYKVIGNGWVTIFNGYQYKVTPGAQSWDASRTICQSWGGDLAVYGVQSMTSRRIILRALSWGPGPIWIGLSDKATEGKWIWVNNENVVKASVLWSENQPDDDSSAQDCGLIQANNLYGYGTDDTDCVGAWRALCEKRLQ